MSADPVADLSAAWGRELPDLDVGMMATVARLNRLALLINRHVDAALAEQGRSLADFDVLAALRRVGAPYQLKPSELSRQVMLSPSGMTHRIDLLERERLVERRVDPTNRRTMPVALTAEGVAVAEKLARLVVQTETQLLSGLTSAQQTSLDRLTSRVIGDLTPPVA
ncbi:MAG: MarR family winged helix-turn-helix transcriptional regulator [Ilumatobacter sp.]